MTGDSPQQFGIWAPHQGPLIAFVDPDERPDCSYAYNRQVVLRAEELGYDSVLLAQQTTNIRSAELGILEPLSAAAGLAEATDRIELLVAVKPLLHNPAVFAKTALGLDEISNGRFAINLISGWFLPELEAVGVPALDHDLRYEHAREWIDIVRRLAAGQTVDHRGRYFTVRDLRLVPGPTNPGGPRVYIGGESEPARQIAAAHTDVFFFQARPVEEFVPLIADMRARPRDRAPLRFAMSTSVFARPTDEQAQDAFEQMARKAAANNRDRMDRGRDSAAQSVTTQRSAGAVVGNAIVGSYASVADQLNRLHDVGIDLVMIKFQPLLEEMERFATEVAPKVGHA
jgi:alkanesulfonate monooxygenase